MKPIYSFSKSYAEGRYQTELDCSHISLYNPNIYGYLTPEEKTENEVFTELQFRKGFTHMDIGKIIFLENKETVCNEWIIAGVDNDGAYLIPRCVISLEGGIRFGDTNRYKDSELRSWLNNEFYNGFSDIIKPSIKTDFVETNGEMLGSKVKCLSVYELGFIIRGGFGIDYPLFEGNPLPIFCNNMSVGNPLDCNRIDSRNVTYWTRSRCDGDSHVMCVNPNGELAVMDCNAHNAVVACIKV